MKGQRPTRHQVRFQEDTYNLDRRDSLAPSTEDRGQAKKGSRILEGRTGDILNQEKSTERRMLAMNLEVERDSILLRLPVREMDRMGCTSGR